MIHFSKNLLTYSKNVYKLLAFLLSKISVPYAKNAYGLLILLLTWQACVSIWQLPSFILPAPKEVFVTLYEQRGILASESLPTLLEIFLGLFFGIVSGCIAGM